VVAVRQQQLQSAGLVLASLDQSLVEWSLREEAAVRLHDWVCHVYVSLCVYNVHMYVSMRVHALAVA